MASRAGPGAERAVAQSKHERSVSSFALPEAAESGMAEQGPSEFKLYPCLKLNEARRAQSERSDR